MSFQRLLLQSRVFFSSLRCFVSFRRLLLLRESVTSRTGSSSLWKASGQDGGVLFFALRKYIHVSLYTSSTVCNVRIQVVDGRSGDCRNFKSVEPLASQNDWKRSRLALCGHLLVKTCKCNEKTSACSLLYLFNTTVNKDPVTGFSL